MKKLDLQIFKNVFLKTFLNISMIYEKENVALKVEVQKYLWKDDF